MTGEGTLIAAQQLLHRPLDRKVAQVRVVLADADKQDGHVGGVDEADEGADHVADGVALGDDEAVEGADGAKGGVEVARLRDRVGADERLADHEDLVGLRKLGEFFQRRHEPLVVVAAAGRVDEDHVEARLRGVRDGVLGDGRRVLAVALLVQLDLPALARRQLRQVADVHRELLHRAGAECVARRDEHLVLVLQQEEADLGQVGRLAHAVDADNGHDVRAALAERRHGRGGDGVNVAEEVERRGGREHLGEGGFHGRLDSGIDAWVG